MLFKQVFERFVNDSPISIMVRGSLEYALSTEALDVLFSQTAQHQYTRELLFSSVVDVMSLVVCGIRPSVHAAYQALKPRIPVSITSLYNKLDHVELGVSAALVHYSAQRLVPVIQSMKGTLPQDLPGYPLRLLDGNHLESTEHRLKVLRSTRAAPLPGHAVVVLDPALMQVVDVIPCADGHAQERSLTPDILARVEPGQLWIGDRNFSTSGLLFGIADRKAWFIIRQHGQSPGWRPVGRLCRIGRIDTGVVYEQRVELHDPEGRTLEARRITLQLYHPTRDGDTELHILTNLDASRLGAKKVAQLYGKGGPLGGLFRELEKTLQAEINTLGYPKAALFAFCIALVAYNILSVVKAALRARWGRAEEQELSGYYLADEIRGTYRGMMIAVPPAQWTFFQRLEPAEVGQVLYHVAGLVKLAAFRRHRSGPRKAKGNMGYVAPV